jgi:hypothetical protein
MCQYLNKAYHRQMPVVVQQTHAGLLQFITADAAAAKIREALFKRLQDEGAMVVAGGFAGNYHDAGSFIVHYRLPSGVSMNVAMRL